MVFVAGISFEHVILCDQTNGAFGKKDFVSELYRGSRGTSSLLLATHHADSVVLVIARAYLLAAPKPLHGGFLSYQDEQQDGRGRPGAWARLIRLLPRLMRTTPCTSAKDQAVKFAIPPQNHT